MAKMRTYWKNQPIIVPGQIRAAAERRNIVPYEVHGDTWVASSGFTAEEEKEIEESYYYKAYCDDSSDMEQHKKDEDIGDFYENDSDYCCDDNDSCRRSGDEDFDCSDDNMDWEELNDARAKVLVWGDPRGRIIQELLI